MSVWVLLLLCFIQGLTEFLPVSSSGHLLFLEQIFGIEDVLLLNLFLHVATLLAVVVIYRKVILNLIKHPFQPLLGKLLLSTVITCIFAFLYEILNIQSVVTNFYGFCFIITGIILLVAHFFQKKSSVVSPNEISVKNAVLVGVVQGFAVLPGISRSGSTISALILSGNSEEKSSEYSFLLSIPIIIGGFIVELVKLIKNGETGNAFSLISPWLCIFAFLITFLVSIASLKITIKLLKKNKFIYFSIYLFILGIIVIIFNFI